MSFGLLFGHIKRSQRKLTVLSIDLYGYHCMVERSFTEHVLMIFGAQSEKSTVASDGGQECSGFQNSEAGKLVPFKIAYECLNFGV